MDEAQTILIADDSEADVDMLMRAFKKAGLANPAQVVRTGDEAVEYLSCKGKFSDRTKFPMPGILLLDIEMPGQDGLSVLKWISQQPQLRRLLVVMLTGVGDRRHVNRAYELGAHSFLVKPANAEDLKNMINFFKGYWLITTRPPDCPSDPK